MCVCGRCLRAGSGRVGVCSVTAGCGLTNAVTGLCLAAQTGSAVVCIAGQHPTTEDGIGSFQEAYGSDICRSFTKSVKRVLDWSMIEFDLRQAFRAARDAPQGAALVEIPTNILYHQDDPPRQRRGAVVYAPEALRAQADPAAVERALEMLAAAERPLIAAGDGVFWSDAGAELRALAERLRIPVYCRRAAQGAVPEDHPLSVRGAWKKPFTGRADVVLAVGFKFWSGEHFGEPPTWNAQATYLQIDPTPAASVGRCRPTWRWSAIRSWCCASCSTRPSGAALDRGRRLAVAAARSPRCAPTSIACSTSANGVTARRRRSIPIAWRASSAA